MTEGVALVPLLPQGGAHPQPPQPKADGAAGPGAALQVPFTGLGRGMTVGWWDRRGKASLPLFWRGPVEKSAHAELLGVTPEWGFKGEGLAGPSSPVLG